MPGPPLRHRLEAFALVQRVLEIHVPQPHHAHRCDLDRRDTLP
jgi:hypothetical protein